MKRIKLGLVVGFITIMGVFSAEAQRAQYQSLFIYNFSKYIKWPPSHSTGDFVIGVYGDPELLTAMQKMAEAKQQVSLGRDMVVKNISSMSDMDNCHILFIAEGFIPKFKEIDNYTAAKPILLVTDSPGMAEKGSVINFVEKGGKIKFELNEAKAESRGLKVSATLVNLAIKI